MNISTCLTEQEQEYYDLYCRGISNKQLRERLGVQYPTPDRLSEEFHITYEEAIGLLNSQFEMRLKNSQKIQFVRFGRVQYIFVMKKGTLRIPLKMKSGLFGLRMNVSEDAMLICQIYRS